MKNNDPRLDYETTMDEEMAVVLKLRSQRNRKMRLGQCRNTARCLREEGERDCQK